jgi:hypothetical protein
MSNNPITSDSRKIEINNEIKLREVSLKSTKKINKKTDYIEIGAKRTDEDMIRTEASIYF